MCVGLPIISWITFLQKNIHHFWINTDLDYNCIAAQRGNHAKCSMKIIDDKLSLEGKVLKQVNWAPKHQEAWLLLDIVKTRGASKQLD